MRSFALVTLLAVPVLAATAFCQTTDPTGTRLDSALRELETKGFSGVIRVDRDGATILEKGYGLANRADRRPFDPSTVVQIGSNTKDFTLVALLQLQERGRLDMRDSLAKYFPAAPADKRNITLAQLANHRAGFPIGLGGDFEPLSRGQFLEAAFKRPLSFTPGAREQYSNTGYALLAAVIEKVSGTTYDEYLRDNILNPLGLKNTGFLLPNFDPKRLAHGYRNDEDQGTMMSKPHATDGPYWNLRGNGGMLSTLDDMHTFYKALFETSTLLKPGSKMGRFNPDEPVGLAGSDLVNFFVYERLPGRHLEIILASNNAAFGERLAHAAIAQVLGLPAGRDGPVVATTPRANARPPAPAVAAMLNDFVSAINAADSSRLATFVAEHFLVEPGAPSVEQRVARMLGMHQNLGNLKVAGLDQIEPGVVEISVVTAQEGAATMKVMLDASPSPKIKGIQMLVGG
jgi:CubicO group peptidase (beta-lactamase class C family)